MTVEIGKIQAAAEKFYGEMPHPNAPGVKVAEYPAFARVATMLKGEFAQGDDVQSAYTMLKEAGLPPSKFEYAWNLARPLAGRFLGREPHILELSRLADQPPSAYYDHYFNSPHPQHPEVKAGDFARYYHAAVPIAWKHQGREPNPVEIVRFASAGYNHDDIANHYRKDKVTGG